MTAKWLKRLNEGQQGISGLETAIILVAFVVVASVFAYTVLSAGVFSAEKGKDAVYSGLEQARGTMMLQGPVIAEDTDDDDVVDQIVFTAVNALDGEPIDLTTTTDSDSDGLLSDESTQNHTTVISFSNSSQRIVDMTWTKTQVGRGDDDNLLETSEKMQITVDLTAVSPTLDAYGTFSLEVKPNRGSTLVITRTIPAVVDPVMDLR